MGNGVISSDDLAQRLVNAKKIMNKVENGNFSKTVSSIPQDNIVESVNIDALGFLPDEQPPQMDTTRINQSKLPDAIKRAMIDHPIALNEGITMDVTQKARRLMEKDPSFVGKSQIKKGVTTQIDEGSLVRLLTPIIENVVRKTLDEIVDKKLTQIIKAQEISTLNENLIIKVGDSLFKGKITGVKKS